MKKTLLLIHLIVIILSCDNKTSKDISPEPSLLKNEYQESNAKNKTDSIKKSFTGNKNDLNSPVKIIASKLLPNKYSDHKDIKITYKNTTKKNIKAIKLEWYCENSFNEPAHGKFFYIQGLSREKVSKLLKAGTTQSQTWEDFSTDANKVIKVRVYYIIYSDGTTWELKN